MGTLSELIPERVFKYFEEICIIPRSPGNCKEIADYIIRFAKEHSLKYIVNDVYSVIIYKDASEGCEDKKPILLQAHLDMVCENDYDYDAKYDVSRDGVTPAVIDDYVYAKGSSLGSVDGIGMAYILSVLSDDSLSHPEIEALFTSDYNLMMKGAIAFDKGLIRSRRMIGFSHDTEGEILNSSAGSRRVECRIPVKYEKKQGIVYDLVICGLTGGHAGLEMDKYRGNANILMGRLLHYIDLSINFDLFYLKGGMQYETIPREAKASILVKEEDINTLEDIVSAFDDDLQKEYLHIEDNLTIYCENKGEEKLDVLDSRSMQSVIFLLMTIPDGIIKLCPWMQSVVQTSLNTGMIELVKDEFTVRISIRSQLTSEKHALSDKLQYLTEKIGGTYEVLDNYHCWEYVERSPLRESISHLYKEMFYADPVITGSHERLEYGAITDKIRDMDIVVIGTAIENRNTTKERLGISSVERTYGFLTEILRSVD
ncbi:MAG: beta-Ala-His dipeptidase [Lachnospiraceae bacterium]|nr:beta-Ala-His dipeptidase [Lachnospiraceae bacterium]